MHLNTSYRFPSTITIQIELNIINIMIQYLVHLFLEATCSTLAPNNKIITLKVAHSTITTKMLSTKITTSNSLKGWFVMTTVTSNPTMNNLSTQCSHQIYRRLVSESRRLISILLDPEPT